MIGKWPTCDITDLHTSEKNYGLYTHRNSDLFYCLSINLRTTAKVCHFTLPKTNVLNSNVHLYS